MGDAQGLWTKGERFKPQNQSFDFGQLENSFDFLESSSKIQNYVGIFLAFELFDLECSCELKNGFTIDYIFFRCCL